MSGSVADQFADIRDLVYAPGTVDEVRLHHVFEHFTRPVACALASAWRGWLRPGGLLRIEVPDLDRTAAAMRRPFVSVHAECVGARHLFGSNEGTWAAHLDGWSIRRMKLMLEALDFEVSRVERNSWKGTYNFEVYAIAGQRPVAVLEAERRVGEFLEFFLVDDSPMEQAMHHVWLADYSAQVKRSLAPTQL